MEELQWLIQNLKICDGRFTVKCSYKQMHPERDGMLYVKGYQHGTMVKGGTVVTHKCVGAESSKISTFDLQQTKILESSSFSNRKHYSTTLPCENRRNKEPNVIEIKQRIMAVSLESPDHNYCRIPSKFFECGGNSKDPSKRKLCPKVFQQV